MLAGIHQRADVVAFVGIVEQDHQLLLGFEFAGQRCVIAPAHDGRRVLVLPHRLGCDHVNMRLMMAIIGADLEGEQRMLERQVGA